MEENIASVETQEVAEPVETDVNETESVETQEVAEPVGNEETEAEEETEESNSERGDADAAFAEMRRNNAELARQNAAMEEALGLFFNGENGDDLSVEAKAFAEQRSPDEVRAELEEQAQIDNLKQDNERLSQQLQDAQVEKLISNCVDVLGKIDNSIKSEDDLNKLGDSFIALIANNVDPETAYYAVQAKNYGSKVNAPHDIGKVNSTAVDRDYYTGDELDNLSKEEIAKNWDKVEKSMKRL